MRGGFFIIIGFCKKMIAAILAAGMFACPAMAKNVSEQRLLNPPETVSKEQKETALVSDDTVEKIFTVFEAQKPEGILKQVQKGNYIFKMPAVWEIPEHIKSDSVVDMIQEASGSLTDTSGVVFLLLDREEAQNIAGKLQRLQKEAVWLKNDVSIQYLQAPIGNIVKMTLHSQKNGADIIQTAYYPLKNLQWIILSVTIGTDTDPTAEDTAAYMLYSLREKKN